jgi:hypothetical protein
MKNIDNIELRHDHEDCYRIVIKSIEPGVSPSWSVKGQMGNYISIHPPGGPWIGVGGRLDCLGIKNKIVESIYVKDDKAFLRTKDTSMSNSMTEEQLLEQLIQDPERLRGRIRGLDEQIEVIEKEWMILSRRKAVYEQLLSAIEPTPKKPEVKGSSKKAAVKKRNIPFNNLRSYLITELEKVDYSMTGRELGELVRKHYNITDHHKFNELVNSVNTTLCHLAVAGTKIERSKKRSNHYEYNIIRHVPQ